MRREPDTETSETRRARAREQLSRWKKPIGTEAQWNAYERLCDIAEGRA